MADNKRLLELLKVVREICHGFAPYENSGRYKILEKLRALEVNIQRDQQDEYSEDKK